jgi:hypothetical protein
MQLNFIFRELHPEVVSYSLEGEVKKAGTTQKKLADTNTTTHGLQSPASTKPQGLIFYSL